MREARHKDIGLQVRAIRDHLDMTLGDVSERTGISRSYISDFERGFKLPTAKYLKYLHDHHHINMNYIFGSDMRMLRPTEEEKKKLDFGKFQEEVDELLLYLYKIPHALYAVLGYFTEYKLKNKMLIDEHLSKVKGA